MKKRAFTFIILASLVTMLAGCEEPINWDRIKGRQVQFEVSSRSDVKTKTSYSDAFYTEGGRNFERINWVTGDQIRIYSSNTAKVSSNIGDYYDYYDYSIASVTPNDRRSDAKLTQPAAGEGLIWVDDPYDVTFYGTYPPVNPRRNESNELIAFVDMSIPATQEPTWSDRVGTPNMSYAYMVSAPATFQGTDVDGQTVPKMHMDFYPLFNAFYFVLASQSGEIQLNSLTLSTNVLSDYLSGRFTYMTSKLTANGPGEGGVSHVGGNGTSVSVNFPAGTMISSTDSVKVTLLTLPPQTTAISDLKLTINYNNGKVAQLPLKYSNGNPLQFPAFHKARITGLAMEGGAWTLQINGLVLPWNGKDKTIDEEVSIDPDGKVKITGTIEETSAWQTAVGGGRDNHYADSEWVIGGSSGYDKNYQIRTLNRDDNAQGYFEMTFTPTAPTGGYWQLIPTFKEGDTESPKHFRFEVDLPGGDVSDQLKGQILNSRVTIRIYPKDFLLSDLNTYDMWFTSVFSPTRDFTNAINADSEFQDVHGDGRFSYWVFRLDNQNGVNYPPDSATNPDNN